MGGVAEDEVPLVPGPKFVFVDDPADDDLFGISVAISGDVVIIGAGAAGSFYPPAFTAVVASKLPL